MMRNRVFVENRRLKLGFVSFPGLFFRPSFERKPPYYSPPPHTKKNPFKNPHHYDYDSQVCCRTSNLPHYNPKEPAPVQYSLNRNFLPIARRALTTAFSLGRSFSS